MTAVLSAVQLPTQTRLGRGVSDTNHLGPYLRQPEIGVPSGPKNKYNIGLIEFMDLHQQKRYKLHPSKKMKPSILIILVSLVLEEKYLHCCHFIQLNKRLIIINYY